MAARNPLVRSKGMSRGPHEPAEMTFKAVALGLFLSLVFGAANAYLGMRAGQTVAATIPAAVIAMALFRWRRFHGTLQEQNIARTAASVGEALVAGAIFTIPAFLMVELGQGPLWKDLAAHYWEATVILLVGGLAGALFMVILRRPICVDAQLPWPESVASVEILRAGERAGRAARLIFGAMGLGALMQLLKSRLGFQVFREYTEGFLRFPQAWIRHLDFDRHELGVVLHRGGIAWSTPALSPALVGIGYIIGPRYASINVAGGVIAWWVLIPLLLFFDPDLARRLGLEAGAGELVLAHSVWHSVVRPFAVGAMLAAAAYTLWGLRGSIRDSWKGLVELHREALMEGLPRTERDLPQGWVALAIGLLLVPVTVIYQHFTGQWSTAIVAAVLMTTAGFLLSAVGAYLVGLVGSSNQPVSGLTLAALVLAAAVLTGVGVHGAAGVAAVLGVAAVVCCACCVSGSLAQDLKAGHLLGGTPWKMQLVEMLAVVVLSFFLMGPIIALHQANLDTGGIGGRALPAPQAGLMAQLAKGIVGGEIAWGLLLAGGAFGAALVLCGARSPMLVAVGMYLPFDTSSAIFLGGLLRWLAETSARRRAVPAQQVEEDGVLLASGLVAGEAVMGILLAAAFLGGMPSLGQWLTGRSQVPGFDVWGGWLSWAGFAVLGWVLVLLPARKRSAQLAG